MHLNKWTKNRFIQNGLKIIDIIYFKIVIARHSPQNKMKFEFWIHITLFIVQCPGSSRLNNQISEI